MPKRPAPKRVAAKSHAPKSSGSGFRPTPEQRQMVEALAGWGVAVDEIARSVAPGGMTPASLRRHFADELGQGRTKADAAIAETLIEQARQGNVAACKLWIERAGRGGETQSATDALAAEIERARQTLERKLNRLALHAREKEISRRS